MFLKSSTVEWSPYVWDCEREISCVPLFFLNVLFWIMKYCKHIEVQENNIIDIHVSPTDYRLRNFSIFLLKINKYNWNTWSSTLLALSFLSCINGIYISILRLGFIISLYIFCYMCTYPEYWYVFNILHYLVLCVLLKLYLLILFFETYP